MNDTLTARPQAEATQGVKPFGFVLRSTSQTNFPWLNTKHNSVGAGNPNYCGNMRKHLGDAQVWKTEAGARSYVDTNPYSGISNLEVVPVYSDPRKMGEKALFKNPSVVTIISIWSKWEGLEGKLRGRDKNVIYGVTVETGDSAEATLEAAFMVTNMDNRPQGNKACSTTAGDMMILNGQHYLVAANGFTAVTEAESIKIQALTSRDTSFGYDFLKTHNLV